MTELVIGDNDRLRDPSCLSALHRLTHLDVSGCPHVHDLAPPARLPLARRPLDSLPGLHRPDALSELSGSPTLHKLGLDIRLRAESLDEALPQDVPLISTMLSKDAVQHTGPRGLHRLRPLEQLDLTGLNWKLRHKEYEEIAQLPGLTQLHLDWQAIDWQAVGWQAVGWQGLPPTGVRDLWLSNFRGTEDLSDVATVFPGLRSVSITLAPHVPPGRKVARQVLAPLPVKPAFPGLPRVM